jgi:riboflavin kinase/FMN adenylyltransferase
LHIAYGLDNYPCGAGSVLALGTFDGLHLGHQRVIASSVARAREIECRSVVVTFDPHPLEVLRPSSEPVLLTTLDERLALLSNLGVDVALVLRFDVAFSRTPAQEWLDNILGRRMAARAVFVGASYTFGYRREGTVERLAEWGQSHGVEVHLVPAVLVMGEPVSSSRVRGALREGLVDEAARLLGRYYALTGRVVRGEGRGRTLGYPTANLQVGSPRKIIPARGVYATIAEVGGRRYGGATNIGIRPTFGASAASIETHLLEDAALRVDEPMTLSFVRRIREERKFPGPEALAQQIGTDVAQVRELLAGAGASIIR